MLKQNVTINEVIELLNGAFEMDSEAMSNLANTRVTCNDVLADHPTIQVGMFDGEYKVGLIGILNGIFGMEDDGCGAIAGDFDVICPNGHEVPDKATVRDNCAICDEKLKTGKLIGFRRIR